MSSLISYFLGKAIEFPIICVDFCLLPLILDQYLEMIYHISLRRYFIISSLRNLHILFVTTYLGLIKVFRIFNGPLIRFIILIKNLFHLITKGLLSDNKEKIHDRGKIQKEILTDEKIWYND